MNHSIAKYVSGVRRWAGVALFILAFLITFHNIASMCGFRWSFELANRMQRWSGLGGWFLLLYLVSPLLLLAASVSMQPKTDRKPVRQ